MNAPSSTSAGGANGLPLRNAWSRFWFQPTDPTVLGLMRIVVGLVVVYIHLAYCFDFKTFFGTTGYWDLKSANFERKQSPIILHPWGWEQAAPPIRTPTLIDRRVAVFDFLKHLPTDKQEREAALTYLYFILEQGKRGMPVSENNYKVALTGLRKHLELTKDEQAQMEVLLAENAPSEAKMKRIITLPDFYFQLDADERLKLWRDTYRFLNTLPRYTIKVPSDGDEDEETVINVNFVYVIEWLEELSGTERANLAKYLRELPEGPEGQRLLEYFESWQSDQRQNYGQGRRVFSIWYHIQNTATMWFFHIFFLFIFVLYTIGFCTRVTSVMTWMAALFYIHRTQYVLFGMDTMMNVLLFYLMIGPSGAALSVDRLILRYRAAKAIAKAGGKSVPWAEAALAGPRPSVLANFVLRLFQIHFCFIYASSGLSKLKGGPWWNATASWMIIANPEFCPVHYQAYEQLLHLIASYRPLLNVMFMGIAYFTLFLEISLPFLVWTRMRPFMVCLAIFLHTGIAWIMGLTCFGLLMMTLLLSYFPASVIRERLLWPTGSGTKMTLRFNSRSKRQLRLASLLRSLDLTGQITWQDEAATATNAVPPRLLGSGGQPVNGDGVLPAALKTLVLGRNLAWMLWVPGVSILLRSLLSEQEGTKPAAHAA
ncbi:MAG: hypothetical protein K8T89_25995 [Planctomycetes bacterium]|nr:hypothetical protein [Planctomycetota bacterium]